MLVSAGFKSLLFLRKIRSGYVLHPHGECRAQKVGSFQALTYNNGHVVFTFTRQLSQDDVVEQ